MPNRKLKKNSALLLFILAGIFVLTAAQAASNFISHDSFAGANTGDSGGGSSIPVWGRVGGMLDSALNPTGASNSMSATTQGRPSLIDANLVSPDRVQRPYGGLERLNRTFENVAKGEDLTPSRMNSTSNNTFSAPDTYGGVSGGSRSTSTLQGSNSGTGNSSGLPVNAPVTAVPEPQTYASMLAGLGLIGILVRRRKQPKTAL